MGKCLGCACGREAGTNCGFTNIKNSVRIETHRAEAWLTLSWLSLMRDSENTVE